MLCLSPSLKSGRHSRGVNLAYLGMTGVLLHAGESTRLLNIYSIFDQCEP